MSDDNVFQFRPRRALEESEPVSVYPFDYPHMGDDVTKEEVWAFFKVLTKLHKQSFLPERHLQDLHIRFSGEVLEMSVEHAPLVMHDKHNTWIEVFQTDKRSFSSLMINDEEEDFENLYRMMELLVKEINPEECIIVEDDDFEDEDED